MRNLRTTGALAIAAVVALSATTAMAAAEAPARVNNNPTSIIEGAPDLLLPENALLERTEDGLGVSMKLVTPEAGQYKYPGTVAPERRAQPEIFTGWVFVFNHPEHCVTNPGTDFPCGTEDFNDKVKFGAYNFGGSMNSLTQSNRGPLETNDMVEIVGSVEIGQEDHSGPPGSVTFALENPMGAEVHVAIAPHGQFDPVTMAREFFSPAGDPACECWWVATFVAAA